MRKVDLRMNELEKYELIKKLVETNGNKKRAAQRLCITTRSVNRLIIKYKEQGKSGFIHGNRNRKPSTSIDPTIKKKVIELFSTTYDGVNLSHFCELLRTNENICVSRNTISNWLLQEDLLSPKAHRSTKKKLKIKLKVQKEYASNKEEHTEIEKKLKVIEKHKAHPTRSRKAYMGELIQMDASSMVWFGSEVTHLHVAIDDASGNIVGAYFDTQETLKAYYNVLHQILCNHGIPSTFAVDKRTVFEYKRKNAPQDYEDTFTQFGYACKSLGIQIEASSIPQTKGRVERLNQTLQSRIPIELKLKGVSTIEEANIFLNSYIKEFNALFSLPINNTKTVYEKQPLNEEINTTLAIISNRKLDAGHSIKYKNKIYQPKTNKGDTVYLHKGTNALIIEAFDGTLYANILDQLFALEVIPKRLETSSEFDVVPKVKQRIYHIPPLSHPWKQASYNSYIAKQKHRLEFGANV